VTSRTLAQPGFECGTIHVWNEASRSAFTTHADASRADAGRTRAALGAALTALSADDRDVVVLVALGDLAYDEAAQVLGIPAGTVASRLNRARCVLAEMLPRPEEVQRG